VPQKSGTGKPLINAYANTRATGQKDDIFSLSVEGNRGGNTITSTPVLATWHIRSEMKRKSLDSDGSFRLNHISWQEM
jgi:hypothetical protein